VTRATPPLEVRDDPPRADVDALDDRINAFNCDATGYRDGRLLAILLKDEAGRLYAGLSGHTWGGTCEVKLLWVEESRRRSGLGTRLLHAAEAEARARGCRKIVLSTHSFQAPAFYPRHGYVVAGELIDYPLGHRQIFFEKALV
jgi:GNAT superfamily N-acetyltransferase